MTFTQNDRWFDNLSQTKICLFNSNLNYWLLYDWKSFNNDTWWTHFQSSFKNNLFWTYFELQNLKVKIKKANIQQTAIFLLKYFLHYLHINHEMLKYKHEMLTYMHLSSWKKCQNLFIVFVIIFAQKKLLYLFTFKSILALIKGHKLSAPEIQ